MKNYKLIYKERKYVVLSEILKGLLLCAIGWGLMVLVFSQTP